MSRPQKVAQDLHLLSKREKQRMSTSVFADINTPTKQKPRSRPTQTATDKSARRSHRARRRVEKMKKIYSVKGDENDQQTVDNEEDENENSDVKEDNSDWEDEADELYEWSQDLTLDSLGVTTPMF